MSKVVCTAAHPVDLDDGRSLPPGESAESVDVSLPANAALVDGGQLAVVGDGEPKAKPTRPHAHSQSQEESK